MTGLVTHRWDDTYDFTKPNDSLSVLANRAADGDAAVYQNRAAWQQQMTATFRVGDEDLRLQSIDWRDVDESPAP